MENEAKKEEAKEQQEEEADGQYDTVSKMKLIYKKIHLKKFRVTSNLNGVNATITPGIINNIGEIQAYLDACE